MGKKQETTWDCAPHTKAKHIILRKYLDAWIPIMTRYNGRVIICDGFAGPGVYSEGEEGSPVVALKALLEHTRRSQINSEIVYLFIELDPKRYEVLEGAISALELPSSVRVQTINNSCETELSATLDYLDQEGGELAPTFAFIDPFGVKGVSLETIGRLMAHQRCEVLITFMLSYIHRFIESPEFENHCDRLFGSETWREGRTVAGIEREQYLRTLFQSQLQHEVGASYVRSFTMRDSKDKTIYDLFFATNHGKGIDLMKEAMWKVDKTGGYTFSDATDPNQETFFTSNPSSETLIDLLIGRFAGQEVPWIPDVEEAIRETPFRIKKRPLQKEARKEEGRLEILNPGARRNTLNEKARIRFFS